MISGMNVDVDYNGVVYHVQTESGSKSHPLVVTTVFKGGAILASRKSDFSDLLDSPDLIENLRERMTRQHRATIDELKSGKIVKSSAPDPAVTPLPATGPSTGTGGAPVQSRARSKTLDDLILDYLATKDERDK